jgi:hypothetical protein
MSVYVIDSNFLIQAHRVYYPLDVAYSFWQKVKQLAYDGKIISINKVRNEIFDHNDELEEWCRENLPNDFFKDTTSIMEEYSKVTAWAISKGDHFLPKALNEFLDSDEADAFIVAFVMSEPNFVVVTQENSEPFRRNKVKIPDACIALNVNYLNIMEMFRQLNETF